MTLKHLTVIPVPGPGGRGVREQAGRVWMGSLQQPAIAFMDL